MQFLKKLFKDFEEQTLEADSSRRELLSQVDTQTFEDSVEALVRKRTL